MKKNFGKHFGDELHNAGLNEGIAWTFTGDILGRETLTEEQNLALDELIAAHDPNGGPVTVPEQVSETQFMRAAAKVGMVTGAEAEAYLARGELPAFVETALALLPEEEQLDARLKAVGAANFHRSDSVFAALIAGGATTSDQVDELFILAGSLS